MNEYTRDVIDLIARQAATDPDRQLQVREALHRLAVSDALIAAKLQAAADAIEAAARQAAELVADATAAIVAQFDAQGAQDGQGIGQPEHDQT